MNNLLHKDGALSYIRNRPIEYYRNDSVAEAIRRINASVDLPKDSMKFNKLSRKVEQIMNTQLISDMISSKRVNLQMKYTNQDNILRKLKGPIRQKMSKYIQKATHLNYDSSYRSSNNGNYYDRDNSKPELIV